MSKFGVYVHIPFCESKCHYCSFVSGKFDANIQKTYFKNLIKQIKNNPCKNREVISIYFGGGTPSFVESSLIVDTLNSIKQTFKVQKNAEISIECNPNSASFEKLTAYKNAGFNRISFGAQSFDDDVLKFLGRTHSSNQIFEAVENAKKAGFENISIDLILGVKPLEKEFGNNIKKIKNLGVKHISAYMLMLEKNTKLFDICSSKNAQILTDDESVEQYNQVVKILKKHKFERYEISNFALPNYQCKHNQNYWQCGEYIGFGVSAHSFFDGKRIENQGEISGEKLTYKTENLTENQKIEEYIMLALRTKNGIEIEKLKQLNFDILTKKATELELLSSKKIIIITPKNILVNPDFYGVINQIILKLIP
ncbi:MAG: radical SAM family heme chaperone HemW [Clostridia bacterium]|nr:radical SAM family heme chaperone HemW [Clostridia bacterium]